MPQHETMRNAACAAATFRGEALAGAFPDRPRASEEPETTSSKPMASARNHSQLGDKDSNLDKRSQNPLSCR
jgi:hypothetical protein